MGYTTEFEGSFAFDREMKPRHSDYLRAFNRTRRMKRNPEIANSFPDPVRIDAGLPIGPDACFYVGSTANFGQDNDSSVVSHNDPPGQIPYKQGQDWNSYWDTKEKLIASGMCQPGLWCQWTVSTDNKNLVWDEGEKFYLYIAWLKYIITNFLDPWGYKISGTVSWKGEENGDEGKMIVTDNQLEVLSSEHEQNEG